MPALTNCAAVWSSLSFPAMIVSAAAALKWLRPVPDFMGLFLLVLLLLFLVSALRATWSWGKILRLGTPLTFRQFFRLRWQGLNVPAIAAADWAARVAGWDIDIELWISFAVLRVDVVRLASALNWAQEHKINTTIGALGAAALAGYDPMDVVQTVFSREIGQFTNEDLTNLQEWGLNPQTKPA